MKRDRKRRMTFIPSERLYDRFGRSAWMVYGVKKSRNYGSVNGRRHVFRLLDGKGCVKYRGFCIFPDDISCADFPSRKSLLMTSPIPKRTL